MFKLYCFARHCFSSTSRDWHHSGKDKILVCSECRDYYKRYAELPSLDGEVKRREITEEEKRREAEAAAAAKANEEEININAIEQVRVYFFSCLR